MEKNGLKLIGVNSKAEYDKISASDFEELEREIAEKFGDNGFAVCYLDYKVLIGKFNNTKLEFYENEKFEPKFLKKLRIFNETKELHIWKNANGFNMRLRTDGTGEQTNAVEAKQILWGTKSEKLSNGYTLITEDRGTELIVPFENLNIDNKKKRLAVVTRNYINYNEYGQATYNDVRFVRFCNFVNENNCEVL